MDASVLAKALDSLEKSWSSLDSWLNFWTALVVIGVAVELIVLLVEYHHEREDFRRGFIHSPEKPSKLAYGLGFLGAGLVAIGVAGEFRSHIAFEKIETEIRDDTRQLVSIADGKAATANLEAARLRAAMADRNLSPEQQRATHDACMKSKWKGRTIWLRSYPNDAEAARLIDDIEVALGTLNKTTPACLKIEDRRGELIGRGTIIGTRVEVGPDRAFSQYLVDLLSGKNEGNLSVDQLSPFAGMETDEILIGIKPSSLANAVANEAAARGRMQQTLGPRQISPQERDRIVSEMKKFAGTPTFIVAIVAGTADEIEETRQYSCNVSETLKAAGIEVRVFSIPTRDWTMPGAWMDVLPSAEGREIDQSGQVAKASIEMNRILKKEGVLSLEPLLVPLPLTLMSDENCGGAKVAPQQTPSEHVRIVIGRKPTPILK